MRLRLRDPPFPTQIPSATSTTRPRGARSGSGDDGDESDPLDILDEEPDDVVGSPHMHSPVLVSHLLTPSHFFLRPLPNINFLPTTQDDDEENEETESDESDDSDSGSGSGSSEDGDEDEEGDDAKATKVAPTSSAKPLSGVVGAAGSAAPRPTMAAVALFRYAELGNPSLNQFFEGMLAPPAAAGRGGGAGAGAGAGTEDGTASSGVRGAPSRAPSAAMQLQRVMQVYLIAVAPSMQV
jgi:hypothetical protein